jgi:CubicO group peptidase (beta-lactamase class C family)
MRNSFFVAFILLVALLPACHRNLSGDKALDAYFQRKMEKAHLVGLQVASIQEGELVWTGSYGVKDQRTGDPVNDSTLFMIASCSKPVTALGVLKLYENGQLDLDDDVSDHLPFLVRNPHYPDQKITLRMLLAHVSSLRDNWDILTPLYTLPEGGDSPLELGDYVRYYFAEGEKYYRKDRNFADEPPASSYAYCNMGYAMLGMVIEQVSGASFTQFMQEEVLHPLHMYHSYWFLREVPHNNVARPHRLLAEPEKGNKQWEVLNHYGYPDYPDGQLRTTVSDYAQMVKLMINDGKVDGKPFLEKETVDEFLHIQFPGAAKHQAIAWNYNEFDNFLYYLLMPRLPAHTGADPGVATVVSFDREKKTGGIIFSNSPTSTFKEQKIFYQEMMKKLLQAEETFGENSN